MRAVHLIVLHYHYRPGGVRRVIELATPALAAEWPEPVRNVTLAGGEAPDATWLERFRASLGRTPVDLFIEPAFGYVTESHLRPAQLDRRVTDGVLRMALSRPKERTVVWAHNLGLGRNLYLSRALAQHSNTFLLVAHHHDWWFDNRWHLFTGLRQPGFNKLDAVARAILPARGAALHAGINHADASVLGRHFGAAAAWLPNPVAAPRLPAPSRVRAARAWLTKTLGDDAPVWLVPCRLLRRKNLAEALLLKRWLRPGAWLVTTGGVSSSEEAAYAEALDAAAKAHGWRLRLALLAGQEGVAPTVPELMAASEAVLLTSLVEGFGLPYVEAAAARRPLLARRLPNVAPDLAEFGFNFPQSYKEVMVAPALFDWTAEHARQRERFAAWLELMPRAAAQLVGRPPLLAAREPQPVAFSRLTLAAQLEVLAHAPEASWALCAPLNPALRAWRARAARGHLRVSPWPARATRLLGPQAYARRFVEFIPEVPAPAPAARASQTAQNDFLRRKSRAENLYPLLWNSTP